MELELKAGEVVHINGVPYKVVESVKVKVEHTSPIPDQSGQPIGD